MTTRDQASKVPLILHNTAPTKELSWEERILLKRNKKLLHNWDYMLWTYPDLDALMKGEFQDLYPKYSKISRGITKADIGRYAALYKYGGVYTDTDYKFLKYPSDLLTAPCTLPVEQGVAPRSASEPRDPAFRLGNALLASVPRHRFWRDFMASILDNNTLDELHQRDPIETTGPIAMTDFLMNNVDKYRDVYLPVNTLYLPDLTWSRVGIAKSKESVGIHMCWGSWRSRNALHHYRTVVRRKFSCLI